VTDTSLEQQISDLEQRRSEALNAGPEKAVTRQLDKGKMLARERIDYFLDEGSFHELDMLARTRHPEAKSRPYTDGVVTGWGTVDGRKVFLFSQDFTINGGSLGEVFAEKIHKLMDMALSVGAPLIGLNDGAGARIPEGVVSLDGYGGIFYRNVQASGIIPQISVILGPCAGGAVYSPAMTDFIFMVRESSHMFITGPDVVKAVTGEDVSLEELGGANSHSSRSGVACFVADDEKDTLDNVKLLLSFLPSNNTSELPVKETTDDPARVCEALNSVLPKNINQPYDVNLAIKEIVDEAEFFEYHANWARSIVCGFARINGSPVGIVANQPDVLSGVLDIENTSKAARFVRTCDAFNLPIITLVDAPGFLPGADQEHGGIIRHGAKLLYAYSEATVPRISVITRKAYGGAYVVMDSKGIGADLVLAWPSAVISVMHPEGAVESLNGDEIRSAADQNKKRAELVAEYTATQASPWKAAERGYVDEVIEPSETRAKIVEGLKMLSTKKAEQPTRKHGNVPL